jgi:hypothetical protein
MNKRWMSTLAMAGLTWVSVLPCARGGDTQLWLKFFAEGKLPHGFSACVEEELRYQDDASEFFDEESLCMLKYDVNDWMNIGLGHRVIQDRKNKPVYTSKQQADNSVSYTKVGDGDHYWQNEQRPTLDVTFKTRLAAWGLDDRSRIEWRMKDDGGDDYLRYRNRLRVKSPWKLTAFKINPYAFTEGYIEDKPGLSGGDRFNRYRFATGVTAELAKNIKSCFYAMMQSDRASGGGWDQLTVLALELGVSF